MLTYQQAYDKIIEAYYKDEIRPMSIRFCFCGTLKGDADWAVECAEDAIYTKAEYFSMERSLFEGVSAGYTIECNDGSRIGTLVDCNRMRSPTDKALFNGMVAALDTLKEIHRARGEDVDAIPKLTRVMRGKNVPVCQ